MKKPIPYSPNLGNLQNHFLPAENQLDGLPEGTQMYRQYDQYQRAPATCRYRGQKSFPTPGRTLGGTWECRWTAAGACRLWSGLRTLAGEGREMLKRLALIHIGSCFKQQNDPQWDDGTYFSIFFLHETSGILSETTSRDSSTTTHDLLLVYSAFQHCYQQFPSRNHSWIYARVPVESADITMVPRKENIGI